MERLWFAVLYGFMAVQAASAQVNSPSIQWQRTFGGTGEEEIHCAVAMPDGGVLVCGYSMSATNDVKTSPNFGLLNFWVLRVDYDGNRIWDKTYGGFPGDYLVSAGGTTDGGFILGGPSRSPASGNKTAPWYTTNASTVDADYWIVKIDADGNKLWDRSFGGTADDQLHHVRQTADGGYILGGISKSPASGNKTDGGFGNYDYWVVRTDSEGNKLWDRCYGGTDEDRLFSVAETRDGGFVLGGWSNSNTNGNKTAPLLPSYNCWVVRIDQQGNVLWDRCFAGGGFFAMPVSIVAVANGGYALACSVSTNGGDFGLYRLDEQGNIIWYRSYGGTSEDMPKQLVELEDSGFLIAGDSKSSASGTKTSAGFGNSDYWIVRTDGSGRQLWDLSFGGSSYEQLFSAVQTKDSGLFFGGWSRSNTNGNKTAPALGGPSDYYAVKLSSDSVWLRATNPAPKTTGSVTLYLSGPTNAYLIDYSADLQTWICFATNEIVRLPIPIAPPTTPASSKRFFRARTAR